MPGTKEGARKASITITKKYGSQHWSEMGKKGGKKSRGGGFASELIGKDGLTGRERAKKYGGRKITFR